MAKLLKINHSHHILFSMLWIILLFLINPSFSFASHQNITLVYSGNLDGELEPCGCSEGGNKGGIKRRATMIDSLRKETPDLFLLSAGGLITSEVAQDKLKSEYILKGLKALDYDAIGVQWQDLSFGPTFLRDSELPFVLSNNENAYFFQKRTINNGKIKLLFVNWLNPKRAPQQKIRKEFSSSSFIAITAALKSAKENNQITVLSTTLPLQVARKTFSFENIDILIIKAKYEKIGDPQKVENTLVIQPGSRGMRLGKLILNVDHHGNIDKWTHQIYPLPPDVADSPRMKTWYDNYNAEVKKDYEKRVAIRKNLESGASTFAGAHACQSCHIAEYKAWNSSKHADAFYALQDVNKAFDPDCIICHTVGFDQKGGFIEPSITENLMHVQCENCHGEAKAHSQAPTNASTKNAGWTKIQMCAQCHIQKHSPTFNLDKYWEKISHGKVKK